MKNLKILFLFVIAGLISFGSCKKDDDKDDDNKETINIGLIVSMSNSPEFAQEIIDAANLAINEINSAGDIFGKKLKLLIEDDKTDSELSVSAANKLIDENNVVSLSLTSSSRCLAVAENVSIAKEVLLISPTATSQVLTTLDDNNFFWRTAPSDAFQGKVAANYVINTLRITEISMLHIDNVYGNGLSEAFKNHFISLGGTVTKNISYEERTSYDYFDFKPILDDLFDNNPSAFYFVPQGAETQKIMSIINVENYFSTGYKPVIVGCDAIKGELLFPNTDAEIIEGMIGISLSGTVNAEFDTNFTNFIGTAPSSNTKYMYDCVYLVAYTMLAANSEIPKEFIKKLQEVSLGGDVIGINEFANAKAKIEAGTDIDYNGASGIIDFDENGDVTSGTYEIWKIVDGEFTTITTIDFPQ